MENIVEMEQYLKSDEIFDYDSEFIQNTINELDLEGLSNKEKAIKIFYYVRDLLPYSVKLDSLDRLSFKASTTLQNEYSYCVPKAVAVATLARAVGIPARLHFVDFINHRISDKLEELWGTNVMAGHSFAELFIDGKWVKVTPALDKKTSERHDFQVIDFDGENDAMMPETDIHDHPHAEYVKDHGIFAELPYKYLMKIFYDSYDWQKIMAFYEKSNNKTKDMMFKDGIED